MRLDAKDENSDDSESAGWSLPVASEIVLPAVQKGRYSIRVEVPGAKSWSAEMALGAAAVQVRVPFASGTDVHFKIQPPGATFCTSPPAKKSAGSFAATKTRSSRKARTTAGSISHLKFPHPFRPNSASANTRSPRRRSEVSGTGKSLCHSEIGGHSAPAPNAGIAQLVEQLICNQ